MPFRAGGANCVTLYCQQFNSCLNTRRQILLFFYLCMCVPCPHIDFTYRAIVLCPHIDFTYRAIVRDKNSKFQNHYFGNQRSYKKSDTAKRFLRYQTPSGKALAFFNFRALALTVWEIQPLESFELLKSDLTWTWVWTTFMRFIQGRGLHSPQYELQPSTPSMNHSPQYESVMNFNKSFYQL